MNQLCASFDAEAGAPPHIETKRTHKNISQTRHYMLDLSSPLISGWGQHAIHSDPPPIGSGARTVRLPCQPHTRSSTMELQLTLSPFNIRSISRMHFTQDFPLYIPAVLLSCLFSLLGTKPGSTCRSRIYFLVWMNFGLTRVQLAWSTWPMFWNGLVRCNVHMPWLELQ
jgi:hypothetical protein